MIDVYTLSPLGLPLLNLKKARLQDIYHRVEIYSNGVTITALSLLNQKYLLYKYF